MADDPLLDVFVNVKVKDEVLRATETAIDEAVNRIKAKFGSMATQVSIATAQAASAAAGVGGGGGSGSGRGATAALADHYRAALRAAQDLAIETGRVGKIVRELGDEDVAQNFKVAANELKDLQLAMRRGREDADPLALRSTLDRLQLVRQRLEEISRVGSENRFGTRDVQAQFRQLVEAEAVARPNFNIESQLRLSSLQGLNFKDRNTIRELVADVQRAQVQFDHLKRTFDGTEDSLDRLILAWAQLNSVQGQTPFSGDLDARIQNVAGGLDSVRSKLLQTTAEMGQSNRSFNTLSNNAYQIGQAFEDAAVGFSLNGFAGAVRGASNNVAFILNDMSRLPSIQEAVAEQFVKWKRNIPVREAELMAAKFAQSIPLIAGIGSAAALLLIPPIVEWLQTLDEVELKLQDISRTIADTAADADFTSGLKQSNDALIRTLKNAGSVKDILKEIEKINIDAANNQNVIADQFRAVSDNGELNKSLENSLLLEKEINAEIDKRAQRISAISGEGSNPAQRQREIETLQRELKDIIPLRDKAREAFEALFYANRAVENQEADQPEKISKAADAYRELQKAIFDLGPNSEKLSKNILNEKEFESANKQVEAFADLLERIRDVSDELKNSSSNSLPTALQAVLDKTREMRKSLDLAIDEAKGLKTEDDVFLDQLRRQSAEYEKLVDVNLNLARAENERFNAYDAEARLKRNDYIDSVDRELTIHQLKLDELELIKRINGEKKNGQKTDLDRFATELQLKQLSDKSTNTKALRDALESNRALQRGFDDFDIPEGFQRNGRRVGEISFDSNGVAENLEAVLTRKFDEMIMEMKNNTEATKKIDAGAKAQ